jgi:enoyl-CoA hydratase/carnithine racemase
MPNNVGFVFLDRPQKANALDSASLDRLREEFEFLQKDENLRVVVLAGRGKTFCGGADIEELRALNAQTGAVFVTHIHDVCKAIRDLPVPVVAQLHGAVIGAGLEIAAACDLRVAAEGTKFAMPEVRLGSRRWSKPRSCRASWARGAPPGSSSPARRSTRAARWSGVWSRKSLPTWRGEWKSY